MGSTTVGFRLKNDIWTRYSAEAQASRVPLATHLRNRLEQQNQLEGELSALRRAVERATRNPAPASGEEALISPGTLLEMLLLLRLLAGPQKATVAQKEVERRGLATWR